MAAVVAQKLIWCNTAVRENVMKVFIGKYWRILSMTITGCKLISRVTMNKSMCKPLY